MLLAAFARYFPRNVRNISFSRLRFKVFRDALQDQRALELLETKLGREKTLALLERDGALAFNEYPRSAQWLLETRERINRAIGEAFA